MGPALIKVLTEEYICRNGAGIVSNRSPKAFSSFGLFLRSRTKS